MNPVPLPPKTCEMTGGAMQDVLLTVTECVTLMADGPPPQALGTDVTRKPTTSPPTNPNMLCATCVSPSALAVVGADQASQVMKLSRVNCSAPVHGPRVVWVLSSGVGALNTRDTMAGPGPTCTLLPGTKPVSCVGGQLLMVRFCGRNTLAS